MSVFKDTARMAVNTGKEEVVLGTAIQLMNCIKTGGEILVGDLSDLIATFRRTFVSTATNQVLFSLGYEKSGLEQLPVPQKPPSKPGGRHVESRMISRWESSNVAAIKGNLKVPAKCSFCKREGAKERPR
jgi:hypothetical protein